MKVIDVEIHRAIPPKPSEEFHDDIWYCDGWRDFKGMGVAVVCTFDTQTFLSRAFSYGELRALKDYLRDDYTAGFNTRGFDIPLLREHGVEVNLEKHIDILAEIWTALGLDATKFNYKTHGGWSLDSICYATFDGLQKSANGALAPVWWQRGLKIPVVDYCLRDVWMEWRLLRHALMGRTILNSAGQSVRLPIVSEWVSALVGPDSFAEMSVIGAEIEAEREKLASHTTPESE